VTGGTETDNGVELIIAIFTFLMALPLVMAWLVAFGEPASAKREADRWLSPQA
jgi:hypothetical protein